MNLNIRLFQKTIIVFTLLLAFALLGFAQSKESDEGLAGKISKHALQSKLMAREMPFNVYLPKSYFAPAEKQTRYSVVFLLHGLIGHFDNWQKFSKLEEHASKFDFIIVMPEGNNGWYTDSATIPDDKYESYIIRELIPEIDKKYRTNSSRNNRAIAGLSMGGYGALKFGLKYPELFSLSGSFSGALGVTDISDKNSQPWVSKSVMTVFGEIDNEARKSNDLFKLVKDLTPEKIKETPFLYQDCGTEDFLISNNRDFVKLLAEKKVPHEYRELPGIHDWKFWDSQVQEFLRVFVKLSNKK